MNHLDLFSGIGGFALAARMVGGIETIGFCEIDPWARKVLAKNFQGTPIHDNVKTLTGNEFGQPDIVSAGYPCQPFSHAGERKGADDDRHLWPEVCRILESASPTWFIGENVAGHVTLGLDVVLSDLERIGYACQTLIIPACAVDARHRRDRVWILAHANGSQRKGDSSPKRIREKHANTGQPSRWPIEPRMDRVANGIPHRMDRLKGLGNAIVPQVAAEIMRSITR